MCAGQHAFGATSTRRSMHSVLTANQRSRERDELGDAHHIYAKGCGAQHVAALLGAQLRGPVQGRQRSREWVGGRYGLLALLARRWCALSKRNRALHTFLVGI